MNETVETCGKSYCEHYPDGLFVCAKCREESTLAHDKACAKIADARADADHWKGECNALQRMVHEVRAEIAERDKLIEQMRDALSLILEGAIHDFHYICQRRDNCLCWGCQKKRVKAALSAAERGDG